MQAGAKPGEIDGTAPVAVDEGEIRLWLKDEPAICEGLLLQGTLELGFQY